MLILEIQFFCLCNSSFHPLDASQVLTKLTCLAFLFLLNFRGFEGKKESIAEMREMGFWNQHYVYRVMPTILL